MGTLELAAELIRIPSVNPDAAGEATVAEVLRARLDEGGLLTQVVASPTGRPSLVARLPGPTDRPALVLLSHTDVVPVEPDAWRHDPFGGEVIDGELWGRGALDMKGIAAMHVEAAAALASRDVERTRELVVVAVADEEAGGTDGAAWLVEHHPELVGFPAGAPPPEVIGEGAFGLTGILDRPLLPIALGEKSPLGVRARATGAPGHGSLPPRRQAIRDLARFVEDVTGPRHPRVHPVMRELFGRLSAASDGPESRLFGLLAGPAGPTAVRALAGVLRARSTAIGALLSDTITPTMVEAGYAFNVVPGGADAAFDCRLLPDTDHDETLRWLRRAGRRHDVEVEELHRWDSRTSPPGPSFGALERVSAALPGSPVPTPALTPGLTDLRYFRARGAIGYGWVPVVLTPELLATFHGHDERIPVAGLEHGAAAMTDLVTAACTMPR